MNRVLKFLTFCSLFVFSFPLYAIEAPSTLVLNESSSESITFSWDAVEGSIGYLVYYSQTSGAYDSQIDDIIEWNVATINWLDADTMYYISVVSIDELWEESQNSLELEAATEWMVEDSEPFSLTSVWVLSFSELELTFSEAIESHSEAAREFRVVNKSDSLDELFVVKSEVDSWDSSKVIITFDRDTLPNTEYDITVIDMKSETGKNIESGIDGISSFITPDSFPEEQPEEVIEPESVEVEPNDEDDLTLNAAPEETQDDIEPVVTTTSNADTWASLVGASLNDDDIQKDTLSEAKETSQLPKTWPAHILLFIFAFLCTSVLFIFRFQRKQS